MNKKMLLLTIKCHFTFNRTIVKNTREWSMVWRFLRYAYLNFDTKSEIEYCKAQSRSKVKGEGYPVLCNSE